MCLVVCVLSLVVLVVCVLYSVFGIMCLVLCFSNVRLVSVSVCLVGLVLCV